MATAANADKLGNPLEQHRERIERYICSMIRDSSEAEDLTQGKRRSEQDPRSRNLVKILVKAPEMVQRLLR